MPQVPKILEIEVTLANILKAISSILLIAGTICYVTWEIRKDYVDDLKNQITTLNQSNSWKLPDTLKQLNSISKKLDSQLTSQEDNNRLLEKHRILLDKNSELTRESADQKEQISSLMAELTVAQDQLSQALAPPQEFTLSRGTSAELAKNTVTLGVSGVYDDWISGNINNESISLNIGNHKFINSFGKPCTLHLIKITPPTAHFKYVCLQPDKKG